MPRAQLSREGGIIHYFQTTELPQAQMVMRLCQDALRLRAQRSAEAKARAAGSKPASGGGGKPAIDPRVGAASHQGHSQPKPKAKRKRRSRAKAARPQVQPRESDHAAVEDFSAGDGQ